jgi:hypothetical protein
MTTSTVDALVAQYLQRLHAAAAGLPPDRRAELIEEIEGHIAGARAAGAAADEAAVRTLLDRLGPPEEIAAAAAEDGLADAVPVVGREAPGTGLETAAVLLLTAGSLVPAVGWVLGVALLWVSRRWTVREKVLGSLVVPGGPGLWLLYAVFRGAPECSRYLQPAPAGSTVEVVDCPPLHDGPAWALLALLVVAPVVVAVLLLRRARARAALEPPLPVTTSPAAWGGLEVAAVLVLGLGSFVVPFVGPLVGLALVWASPRWTRRQKTVATVLTVVPVLLLAVLPLGGLLVARWSL